MIDTEQLRAGLRLAEDKRQRLENELHLAEVSLASDGGDAGRRERADNLRRGLEAAQRHIEEVTAELADREDRHAAIRDRASRPENVEREPLYLGSMPDLATDQLPAHIVRSRDVGMRAIERVHRDSVMTDRAAVPKVEWSTVQTGTTTTGQKTLLLADWSGYVIADRLGTKVELIPHLFGATNRFPTGQRGLFMMWRTGTVVSKPNAFRYLETK